VNVDGGNLKVVDAAGRRGRRLAVGGPPRGGVEEGTATGLDEPQWPRVDVVLLQG